MTMTASALASEPLEMIGKKLIGIEHLLQWAYRQELPKAHQGANGAFVSRSHAASGWDAIHRYSELLTLVDISPNHFGCVPDFWGNEDVAAHPDALLVAEAVARLAGTQMDWEDGFDVLSDLEMLTAAERADLNRRGFDIARAKGQQLAALVMRVAMLGRAPDWSGHGTVERRAVLNAKGAPAWFRHVARVEGEGRPAIMVEVDGFDAVRRRPFPGAFGKTYLDPCPSLLAADRIDYQAWIAALGVLADDLADRLAAHRVAPTIRQGWPWESGEAPVFRPRIFMAQAPHDFS